MPWSKPQKARVHAYRRYAGWSDDYYHERLADHTGCRSSTDRRLTQTDFEAFMPVLEVAAHLAHVNGAGKGNPPKRGHIDWHYWRERRPADGRASTRQCHAIWELVAKLALPDPLPYLRGMLDQAHGGEWPPSGHLTDLLAWQAGLLIEALKDRARHAS